MNLNLLLSFYWLQLDYHKSAFFFLFFRREISTHDFTNSHYQKLIHTPNPQVLNAFDIL